MPLHWTVFLGTVFLLFGLVALLRMRDRQKARASRKLPYVSDAERRQDERISLLEARTEALDSIVAEQDRFRLITHRRLCDVAASQVVLKQKVQELAPLDVVAKLDEAFSKLTGKMTGAPWKGMQEALRPILETDLHAMDVYARERAEARFEKGMENIRDTYRPKPTLETDLRSSGGLSMQPPLKQG